MAIVPYGAGTRSSEADQVSLAGVRRQIELVRAAAGARFADLELSIFVDVTLSKDRERTIAELADRDKADPDTVRRSIYRGIGTIDQVHDHIADIRRQLGITYFCLRGPHVEELAPVVRDLAGS